MCMTCIAKAGVSILNVFLQLISLYLIPANAWASSQSSPTLYFAADTIHLFRIAEPLLLLALTIYMYGFLQPYYFRTLNRHQHMVDVLGWAFEVLVWYASYGKAWARYWL